MRDDAPRRGRGKPAVAIEEVELSGEAADGLVASNLDRPRAGARSDRFVVEVRGFAIPSRERIDRVEVRCYDEVLGELSADGARPKVAEAYPDAPGAAESGFASALGAFRLPPQFTLTLHAVFEDGTEADIARIRGSRRSLGPASPDGVLPPIVLSSPTGRSGTTWSVQLLGKHPQLITYPPLGVEPRPASYWLEIAAALAEPASFMRALRPRMDNRNWWLGDWRGAAEGRIKDDVLNRFLGHDSVERLAELARERVAAFYDLAAQEQGKDPVYFLEKGPLGRRRLEVMADVFPGLRQVIVFRDPRDTVCSILSYRKARPHAMLVQDGAVDEDFMEEVARNIRGMLHQSDQLGDRTVTMRYEDLIESPEGTLDRVLAELGLDSSSATIDTMLAEATKEAKRIEQHITSASVSASIGRWRHDMDPEMQERAQTVFADVLEELRYV